MEVHGKFAFMLVSAFDVLKSTLSDIRKKERNPLNMTHKNELAWVSMREVHSLFIMALKCRDFR